MEKDCIGSQNSLQTERLRRREGGGGGGNEGKKKEKEKRTMTHTVFWDVTPCIKDVLGKPAVSIFRVEK